MTKNDYGSQNRMVVGTKMLSECKRGEMESELKLYQNVFQNLVPSYSKKPSYILFLQWFIDSYFPMHIGSAINSL